VREEGEGEKQKGNRRGEKRRREEKRGSIHVGTALGDLCCCCCSGFEPWLLLNRDQRYGWDMVNREERGHGCFKDGSVGRLGDTKLQISVSSFRLISD
jgi:hypothetical protein